MPPTKIQESNTKIVSGAWLPGSYKIEQLHFHWGNNSELESEHTLDSRRHPLEMHLVHYNSEHHDVQAAHDKEQGLAVISVLFDISEKDNEHLEPIMEASKKVRLYKVATEKLDRAISLAKLLLHIQRVPEHAALLRDRQLDSSQGKVNYLRVSTPITQVNFFGS